MTDDPILAQLGQFTPEGVLTPGYGDHYLFMVGRDDCHSVLKYLFKLETLGHAFNQYGYDDEELNQLIMQQIATPHFIVQGTLDRSQAGGVHEKKLLDADAAQDPVAFANSIVEGQSETHQISHTKGGVLFSLGLGYEGSMNWSASGEGIGINISGANQPKGWKAQNNTLLVSRNPVMVSRFRTQLDIEHKIAQQQAAKRAAAAQ